MERARRPWMRRPTNPNASRRAARARRSSPKPSTRRCAAHAAHATRWSSSATPSSACSCCSVVGIAALFLGKQRFEMPGPLPADKIVNIPHGSGIRDIADVLQREGVIDQPWVFVGGVLALKAREDLKAGEYQFTAHASLRDVVATIVEGKVISH